MNKIPENEFKYSFSRSSGPGGQNVNKVNSKVTLNWNINDSSQYNQKHKERFIKQYHQYIADEKVVITSQKTRSQKLNIDDCQKRLHQMLLAVEFPPKKRTPTKPTKNSIKKRLNIKKLQSIKKKLRSEKF